MTNSNLLKEAIADAKAVRETALANAKIALEEAFTPRIQSMLSARIAEEEGTELDMEEDAEAPEMEAPVEAPVEEPVAEDDHAEEEPVAAEGRGMNDHDEDPTDEFSEEMAPEEPMEEAEGEDLELEAIIRELEDEMATDDAPEPELEAPVTEEEEAEEAPVTEDGDEEDVSLEEIMRALREDDGEEEVTEEEAEETDTAELEEAMNVIKFLRSKINEVNLLNAKLLFSNKLFRNHSMNESQKMKVIENFDRASNLREVKLVFATLAESFNLTTSRTKRSIKESYASKSSRSTAPSKKVISEGTDLAARWKKLANL